MVDAATLILKNNAFLIKGKNRFNMAFKSSKGSTKVRPSRAKRMKNSYLLLKPIYSYSPPVLYVRLGFGLRGWWYMRESRTTKIVPLGNEFSRCQLLAWTKTKKIFIARSTNFKNILCKDFGFQATRFFGISFYDYKTNKINFLHGTER